jgi:hypothetical protein
MKGNKMYKFLTASRNRVAGVLAAVAAFATLLIVPAAGLAVESEGAKDVKTITTQVSSEGTEIILAVLAGLVTLIALVIVLPKAVGFIRRFI